MRIIFISHQYKDMDRIVILILLVPENVAYVYEGSL